MAFSACHLWWCQISDSSSAFLGVFNGTGLEITNVRSTSTNWQIFPSNNVYYIRNEAAGPQLQLGVIQSTINRVPKLIKINLSSAEQQWTLQPDAGGVRLQNVALGDLGLLSVSKDGTKPFFGEWGNSHKLWNILQGETIYDASFLKSSQVWLPFAIRS